MGDIAAISASWGQVLPESKSPLLTDPEFQKFSALIYDNCGIKLPPIKKTMLSARLHKRLRALGMSSFKEYLELVTSPEGQVHELIQMLDVVSTNKTEFFREPDHFTLLAEKILPEIEERLQRGGVRRRLRVWSAGCSSGEESYTLGIVLAEYGANHPGFDFFVLGTDICTEVLVIAERAIYPDERLAGIPNVLLRRYFMRGKGSQQNFHRIIPELRQKIAFRRLNFKDEDFGFDRLFDIIFCRNVIIYFDRATQSAFFEKIHRHLAPGGYLLIGHSESLEGIHDRMKRVAPTVYRK
ncbi:MAG: protein-glutamate O-methyltransferase [Deltaproteobacteria bacterium]